MAIQRRVNWISQQRVDVPDMRSVESAVSNDFDQLIQSFVTNTSQGYILRGFEISMVGAIGGAASNLQLLVDPGAVMHIAASQSGTVLMVPPGTQSQQLNGATNSNVSGAFVPNSLNYIGLDYTRFIDPTTSAQVYVWDPTTNSEVTKTAPRAQILQFNLSISTVSWPANILPIAIVQTDAGNNVVSITDCRWLLFRLATGGANPDPFDTYPWTAQPEGRTENPPSSSSNGVNPFAGGDKMLFSLKDWMNAIMTSLLEIKGTTYWYSPSAAGSITTLQEDLGNTITTGKGVIGHSETVPGLINWDEDIFFKVIGSRINYRLLSNAATTDITLADNEVEYLNLVRNIEITPNLIWTNGSPTVMSVGAVAWTAPLQSGDWIKVGSDTTAGYYQILTVDSLSQVTLTENYGGSSTGAPGAPSRYSYGSYQTSPAPSSNRDIQIADRHLVPAGGDVFWFLLRSDNGGVIPRVYVRFLGAELEQGESEDIDDGVSRQLLTYIGTPSESAYRPLYVSALTPGSVPEITDLTCGTAASLTSNQYFFIGNSGDHREYYVWVNKDGTGVDPAPDADKIGVEWVVSTGQTNAQVATALAAALSGTTYLDFTAAPRTNPNQHIVRVTNNSAGATTDAANFNVGAPFAVSIIQQGTGTGNAIVNDGDNLTLGIKKLDGAIGQILANADNPNYDEVMVIAASVMSGTNITLPLNSRESNIQQLYTTGKGRLEVYLNGQYLNLTTATVNTEESTVQYHMGDEPYASFVALTGATDGGLAVEYTPSLSVTLSDMRMVLSRSLAGSGTGNVFARVRTDGGATPSGTVLATSVLFPVSSLINGFNTIVDFTFSTPLALVGGTTYWFTLETDSAYQIANGAGGCDVEVQSPNITPADYPAATYDGSVWSASAISAPAFELDVTTGTAPNYDWSEVGVANTFSQTIQINRDLVPDDLLTFRITLGGGGGAPVGPAGPTGPTGPAGSDAVGGPIAISTKTLDYVVLLTDNVLKGDATGGAITFTLPAVASATGRVYWFTKIDASANAVNVAAFGAELINGLNIQSLTVQYESFILVNDGVTWSIF